MATPTPYISHKPGDLITAEDWNAVQDLIQQDMGTKISKAIGDIKKVDQAGDSGTLDGKTLKEIEDDILKKVFEQLPARTGYKMIFKSLTVDDEKVIRHDLKAFPLVDVYQLDYFRVICSEDDKKREQWVNFYLYYSNEKRFRPPVTTGDTLVIESTDPKIHPFKIPFGDMLYRYSVKYNEDSGLGDIVTDFWEAFFADPNDQFDEDQYCHSPWFDRCCTGGHSTVGELKKHGDWDNLWFQVRPVKTINYPLATSGQPGPNSAAPATASKLWPYGIQTPHNILISHFDFDTLGVRLLDAPIYPTPQTTPDSVNTTHEKVMLLLKV